MAKRNSNGGKAQGKKTVKKGTPKRSTKSHSKRYSSGKGNRPQKATAGKGTKKNSPVHSPKIPKVRSTTSGKTTAKGNKPPQLVTERRRPNKEQTDFHFQGIRSVDKKIQAFGKGADKAISKQLERKDGKPPKGIIVTVYDKKGREHTTVSSPTFVVNKRNVIKHVDKMLKKMKNDFMEWKDMKDPDDLEENPYADYNPETIHAVTIKYIYGKKL